MGQEIFSAFNSTATNIFILTNIFLLLYSNIHSILVFVHQHNTVFVYFLFFQNFITCFIDETFFFLQQHSPKPFLTRTKQKGKNNRVRHLFHIFVQQTLSYNEKNI